MRALAILAPLALLAGCMELEAPAPGVTDEREWVLSGTFTRERTQDDLDHWCDVARAFGNECVLMESYPEQYRLTFASEAECRDARERLRERPNIVPGVCTGAPDPSPSPETPTSSAPGAPDGEFDLDVVRLTWSEGDPSDTHRMEWDVVEASRSDGLVTLQMTTYGIEGGDFRATFFLRVEEAPASLAHEKGAPEEGTFDLAYTEAVFWRGRPVDTVVSVSSDSVVRVTELDVERGRLAGSFHIDFMGRCTSAFNCNDENKLRRTVLDGSFGP